MKIDISRISYLINALKNTDVLYQFVASPLRDELEQMQADNLSNLLSLANGYGMTYIFLGQYEICGCEDITIHGYPAIWEISKTLGLHVSGNSDQSQIVYGPWFPSKSLGAYNVIKKKKITKSASEKLQFNRVVADW